MKSIRVKILSPVIIMLLVFLSSMGLQYVRTTENLQQIETMNSKHYATLSKAKDLKLNVVQVQQFLTDISATRAAEGFDDGFEVAEEHAQNVEQIIDELIFLNPEHKEGLQQINDRFDSYYEIGKDMARLYIENGPESGNTLMVVFDEEAENINNAVDEYELQAEKEITNSIKLVKSLVEKTLVLIGSSLITASIISAFTWVFATKNIYRPIKRLVKDFEELSLSKDLTRHIEIKTDDELELLANSINDFIDSINHVIVQVKNSGQNVATSASSLNLSINQSQYALEEVNNAIENVTVGASEQAKDMSDISFGIQKISTDMDNNKNKIIEIDNATGKTRKLIDNGLEAISNQSIKTDANLKAFQKVIVVVDNLVSKIEEIESILSTITNISKQTNLLALNAAIEAARAGEHGRGFSIVADEVRSLAEESASSTEQISKILYDINADAKKVVHQIADANSTIKDQKNAVDSTSITFKEITTEVENIITAIISIGISFKEIGEQTNYLSNKTQDVSAISEEVSASSEEQNATMQEISATTEHLSILSTSLEQLIATFKI